MHTDTMRRARLGMMAAACLATLAAGACKKANNANTGRVETPPADTGATGMAPADTTGAAATNTKYTDANIVALLDEANMADSAAGAFARGKAKDPGVKAFAKMMMGEHHALRVQGQALAKKLNVTPEPPSNDPVKTAGDSEMQALRSAGTGAGFDRTYIDQEVTIHKAVLDLADQAHSQTQNAELKALIEKAKPTIQKHLDRAEELQKTLGKTTT
jgi:putative membrane protein